MPDRTRQSLTTGLVLPGGGARGAYQVGALKAIAEIVPGDRNPFPVIAGASVGALNAVALAARAERFGAGVAALSRFWRSLRTRDVYRTEFLTLSLTGLHWVVSLTPLAGLGLPNPRSLLDNAPLRDLIDAQIDFEAIDAAIASGALEAVSVTASSYDRNKAVSFFQGRPGLADWTRARREGVSAKLGAAHLMAAAALPFVFPAERIGTEYFGDGSLRLTSPLSPAIRTGADRVLVITTRDSRPDIAPKTEDIRYPSIGTIGGNMLDIIFLDNVDADIERAKRINKTLSLIGPERRAGTSLREIEVMVLEPAYDIRDVARDHAHEMPWTVRMLLGRLGMWGRDWRLASYLMFEPAYCAALIEMGYRDTMARADEVAQFLGVTDRSAVGRQRSPAAE